MFSYLHNLVHALKLPVPKYQPLHRYSSTLIQVFPAIEAYIYIIIIIHSNIYACPYYVYYTFEHICMLSLFIMQALRISINSEWCRIVSVVVTHAVATSLMIRRDAIILLLYSPAIFHDIIITFYYL